MKVEISKTTKQRTIEYGDLLIKDNIVLLIVGMDNFNEYMLVDIKTGVKHSNKMSREKIKTLYNDWKLIKSEDVTLIIEEFTYDS